MMTPAYTAGAGFGDIGPLTAALAINGWLTDFINPILPVGKHIPVERWRT
jgi:hypothetical protein